MNQNIEHLRDKNRNRLIGLAQEHLQLEGIACARIFIPGGDRVIAIGTPAEVRGLLADDANTPPLTGAELDKEAWITRAAVKLQPYEFENARAYAESLYDTYVIECGDWGNNPEGAVEEDMSYWGD